MLTQFNAGSAHTIIHLTGHLWVPFEMSGVMSYLPMRRLTDQEVQECTTYDLTSDIPWDPYSPSF
jgi:FtsP/CotA-like multicopper oxidase with cupredoxin domain